MAVDAVSEMEAIKNDRIDIAKLIELFRLEAIDKRNLLSQIFPPDMVVNILSNFEDAETQRGMKEDYFNEFHEYHRNKQQSNRARTG